MMCLLAVAVGWIVFAGLLMLVLGKGIQLADRKVEPCPLELEDAR